MMRFLSRGQYVVVLSLLMLALTSISVVLAQEPVTIEWWTVASEEFDEAVQRALVEKFNAEHTDIQVNMTLLPPDGYDERMQTTLGAGQGAPDVALFWNANWYPQALDITEYLEADPDLSPDMYLPGFWNTRVTFGEEIIGLPLGVGANFVMYNKDMFDAAGVAYPEADWTTEDYIATVAALADPEARVWGGDRPRGPYRAIWYNLGAKLYSDDSTTTEGYLNSAESIAAYQWLWDLVATDGTPTPADLEVLGTEGTGPVDLFMADRLAMATLNQGHMLNAVAEGKAFGIVPEPQAPGGSEPRYVNAWSLTASIWEGTEHPDEAYEWLSYWVGPEGQQFLMENGNLIPSMPSVLEQWKEADTDYGQAFLEVLELEQVAAWDNAHPCKATVLRAVQDAWDLVNLAAVERDGIQATLDGLVPAADAALAECVGRLGG
jgi:multiple sugar transport system substrate-binding protein